MLSHPKPTDLIDVGGITIEVERRGSGSPLLFLAGEEERERDSAFVDMLARGQEVVIVSPPGFGRSGRPDWVSDPHDIAFILLDLIETLKLDRPTVVGCSLGGWIAAEMATIDDGAMERLVLIAPYGIKVGGPTDRDIQDIWLLPPQEVTRLTWHDPSVGEKDYSALPESELEIIARNSESFARFCWEPYMHNPKLSRRLHRIGVPTLFVWGEQDGIVTPDYGRAYQGLVPGAQLRLIPDAGHLPHLEQPQAALEAIMAFADKSNA